MNRGTPSDAESAIKRRKTEGQTLNPPQKETGGGEISNSPSPSPREIGDGEPTGRNEIVVTMDRDSLCINGHVACSSCWEKLQYIYPTCNKPIGGKNIALEAVLESMRLSCPNANLGCCKSLSYSQMQLHNDTCEFSPYVFIVLLLVQLIH